MATNAVSDLGVARQGECWDEDQGFHDAEPASSSGATHVPNEHSRISSLRTMPRRDSGLPHDTRNIMGNSGNVFDRLPAREGRTSNSLQQFKEFGIFPLENIAGKTKRAESEMRREPQNSSILVTRFQRRAGSV